MNRKIAIRWKLTLWYSALLLGTFVVFGAGIYVGLAHLLYDGFAEQVGQEAMLAQAAVAVSDGALKLDPSIVAGFQDREHYLRVLDARGATIIDTTSPEDEIPATDIVSQSIDPAFGLRKIGGAIYGIATVPVISEGRFAGLVEVGASRTDVDQTLRSIGLVFALALPVLMAVSGIGGYLIAGRALSPVDSITYMAANIRPDELGARIALDLPDDELGRLARTFDAMLERIEIAFDRQRQFTDDAAHELRTPLSLMRSQVELTLARPRSSEEYQEALVDLGADIERLTSVVSVLLALARADAGTLQLMRGPVDMAEIISQVLASYAPQSEEANVKLLDQSSPVLIEVDEGLVVQMLVNLVDNALAHTPPCGIIAVGVDTRNSTVCLWVEDSGSGIAAEHHDRIFERFYRVDYGRSRRQGGAGLGLAFCRAIAEAHGGELTVESRPGQGSRFVFCCPIANSIGSVRPRATVP